jgi:sarcosine oxidase, subunit delta
VIRVPCPWCGSRSVAECVHHGEPAARPEVETATPPAWRGYLYLEANPCGWVTERWFHRAGCRRFFTVERHTLTNEIRTGAP